MVLRLLNRELTALKLGFLLQLLRPEAQFLLRDAILLEPSRLGFTKLRPELLLLHLQPGLFQRQLSALRSRFLLQLLGAEIDLLLRQSSLLEPTGLLLGQCLAKLPRLFGKPLLLQ